MAAGAFERQMGTLPDPTIGVPINPAFRYLRVEIEGRSPALMVLGYLDPHPQGMVEVWYSGAREVLKIQNGRIVGTMGLELDWRSVAFAQAPPAWDANRADRVSFERVRDVMPGYRYGIRERIDSIRWRDALPVTVSPSVISLLKSDKLSWFRERVAEGAGQSALPAAWYAMRFDGGGSTMVYSEQCLSATLCLRLIPWPVQGAAP